MNHSELIEILSQIKVLKNLHDSGNCKHSDCPHHCFFFKPEDIKFEGENIILFSHLDYLQTMGYIKETHISDIGQTGLMYTVYWRCYA